MKILFVGSPATHNRQIADSVRQLGIDVRFENEQTIHFFGGILKENSLLWRISQRFWRLKHVNRELFNNRLISICRSWQPDIFLTSRGFSVKEGTVKEIRKLGIETVNWCIENVNHPQWHDWFFRMVDWYDLIFSWDSSVVRSVKNKKSHVDIRYLPLGFNPNPKWGNITEADRQRFKCDVGFVGYIGNVFTERERLLESVIDAGIDLKIFSRSDTKRTSIREHCFGPLTDEELGKFYRIAGVCLNDELEPRGSGLILRTFEIASSGGFQLFGWQEDLPDMFILGKEIEVFHSKEEAIEKIRYYLAHPEERKAIAEAGRIRALRDHTMVRRVEQLLAQL